MQIIYTCPKCGADLEEIELTSYPPQREKHCPKCNYTYKEPMDNIVRIPFVEPADTNNINTINTLNVPNYTEIYSSSACSNCSNNPKNGGSGICHCILGTHITNITC